MFNINAENKTTKTENKPKQTSTINQEIILTLT